LLHRERQRSTRGNVTVDRRRRLAPADGAADPLELACQLELVARLNHTLEANTVDSREERQLASVRFLGEHRHCTGLRHGLDDQHAWHDRPARKVTGQVPLVRAHALSRDYALAGLEVDNLVEQEERVAVRQDRLDILACQGGQPGESNVTRLAADSLSPEVVEPLLRGRFGCPYLYFERCESTQSELAADAPEGAVAVAEEQLAGRGRLGRPWYAPARTSVLVSINLRPAVETTRLPELSVVAGLAAADAIAAETDLRPEVRFPNDLLIDGRKVAGILAEAREDRVVLGIGINTNVARVDLPQAVDTPATSLLVEGGSHVDRARLLATLLEELERRYDAWVQSAA
jgi:BirA family transcriptional regulator, biotin operon repressor / biotin---[acetyl-CoA-carboxylase] ligase